MNYSLFLGDLLLLLIIPLVVRSDRPGILRVFPLRLHPPFWLSTNHFFGPAPEFPHSAAGSSLSLLQWSSYPFPDEVHDQTPLPTRFFLTTYYAAFAFFFASEPFHFHMIASSERAASPS